MKHPITMPALSDTMNNGRLIKWLKQPGDIVKKGEVVADVETDKAIMEVEAFHDGFIAGPLAAIDSELPVGQTIGFVADTKEESQPTAAPPASVASPTQTTKLSPATLAQRPVSAVVAAMGTVSTHNPPVRRNVLLPSSPASSGSQAIDAGPDYRIERASSLREAVANNMIACAATPTFHVTAQLPLAALMARAKALRLSLNVLLARACALSIVEHPLFNAAYTPKGLARRERVDVGIAVDSTDGLITPVLRDVARKPLAAIDEEWKQLREKVGTRRLVPSDYSGATFYVSDLGTSPLVRSFDSIVPAGAAAIASIGAAVDGNALFTLSCDHRVVFGGDAARFLETLNDRLNHIDTWINEERTP